MPAAALCSKSEITIIFVGVCLNMASGQSNICSTSICLFVYPQKGWLQNADIYATYLQMLVTCSEYLTLHIHNDMMQSVSLQCALHATDSNGIF